MKNIYFIPFFIHRSKTKNIYAYKVVLVYFKEGMINGRFYISSNENNRNRQIYIKTYMYRRCNEYV
ncbi:hypothetical protein GCM10008904_04670 [Paraclostridium ghonii]